MDHRDGRSHPSSNPHLDRLVVETEHRPDPSAEGRRRGPLRIRIGVNADSGCPPSPRHPTNRFTSNSTPSLIRKKHAFDSLFAIALIATTRFVFAILRWNHARSSGLYRTA